MSEVLITELTNFCKGAFASDMSGVRSGKDLWRVELNVLKAMLRLCRVVIVRLFKELGTGYEGTSVTRDGVEYRFVDNRPKTLHGLFGTVTYERAYYAGGTGTGWVPLDEQLGIKRRHTPGCQYFLSMFAAHQAHAEGLRQFHEVFRADGRELLSVKKAFAMVRAVTGGLERQRQQEISDHLQADAAPEVEEPIGGTVAVSIDAAKVPVRANERVDESGKGNRRRKFRDAKTATVAAVQRKAKRKQARCTNVSYVAASEHADQFFPRIEVELRRRCRSGTVQKLVVLADGAEWIWERAETLADYGQRTWYVLDFWHACEHLAEACRLVYGEGSKRGKECYRKWKKQLRGSRVAAVIKELVKLRDSDALSAGQRHDLQGQINYFRVNEKRMDYRQYRTQGLPIGSGTVESACKNVVGARLKGSGMIWSLPGAQGMLQLRASAKSDRFQSDYERLLSATAPQADQLMAA